ncbi:MAG: cysteine desulfurase [Halobacteriota archaeon]|nr:cysteine desulfurase [Halobacteriota archaeon]
MNVKALREDYPILSEGIIYMDSAATSLTPEPVINSILDYYRKYNSNVGRGVYRLSQVATQRYDEAHEKVAGFINARSNEIIFTKNTTEGINIIASGLDWKRGDIVVTSVMEHHSNYMPFMRLKDVGVDLEVIKPDQDGVLNLTDFERVIGRRTKLVALTHASNVLGSISPIREIAKICRENDAMLLVDGAQSVPHMPIDVKELDCDFLSFSGHKMLGPTGTGVLFIKESLFEDVEPLFLGGGTITDVSLENYTLTDGYERFEGGTPNIAGVIGLGKAVDYLKEVGMEEVREHEVVLTKRLIEGLSDIDNLDIYGPLEPKKRVGTVSFNIKGINSHDVALILDEMSDIMVRSGHHCCMPLIKELGLDGSVRASLYLYNTEDEVEKLLETVEDISRSLV